MTFRTYFSWAVQAMALLIVFSLVLGTVLGQPILLSYVETGSMEPGLEPGDGFVAIPTPLAGDIEEGDVVVFEAEELQGGGLTTHRIVGETERGYITRGDANPFTDQAGGEPPVKEAQIVAKAWTVGGSVVAIPGVGTAATGVQTALETTQRRLAQATGSRALLGTQGIAYLVFGVSLLGFGIDWYLTRKNSPNRERNTNREDGTSVRLVLIVLAVVLMSTATAAMVVPAGSHQFGIVSADFESENPTVIPRGTSTDIPYLIPNSGLVPVHVYVEPASEGIDVEPRHVYVGSRSEEKVTLTLKAPAETGYYRRFVVERRYLGLLPESVIEELYGFHPWAPLIAINGLLGGGIYALGALLVGNGRVRFRERSRDRATPRYRQLLRELYQ